MSVEIKSHLTELLTRALAQVAPQQPASIISLDRPKQPQHGDYSVSVALQLARPLKRASREIAQELVAAIPPSDWLASTEVAGPGFINLRLHAAAKQFTVKTLLAQRGQYGRSERGQGQPVVVGFVSANPTGPLHLGPRRRG